MESTHRIRRNLDEAYCLLRQSEALVGDLRQTIEHSWRLLERSYTILAKISALLKNLTSETRTPSEQTRGRLKILFISY